ncbi:hypothetical protein VCRA2122O12_700001 [Vibrio crassostreae]|nr:hypothetical protein VCRA2114E5_630001 [Vibrio crassostreae]CAK2121101.1 hypothetical protein VCRA2110O1_650001 [Vibrio crassostreae]CAK2140706.1 hypothetical protein VCRA2110O4_710001 [Vibrio crassostreae]CAK2900761.1 hypothetical protein VCRA2110O3_670001 [Vibrio crassostreae]CAK2913582.1 hypothetical protein VCRA2110O2_520002 [Vibrio crassostreae]
MNKLYIIGNGFDLHHGLPTSLTGFRNYSEALFPNWISDRNCQYG